MISPWSKKSAHKRCVWHPRSTISVWAALEGRLFDATGNFRFARPTPKGVGPVCFPHTRAAGGGVCVRSVLTHSAGDSILSIIIALIPTTHARARRQQLTRTPRRAPNYTHDQICCCLGELLIIIIAAAHYGNYSKSGPEN